MTMIKIGLIGAGFMGNTHSEVYKILSTLQDVKLVAVADIRTEKAEEIAKYHGAKVYSTGEELIADTDIDVVDICLPTFIHAKFAKMAMESGKNVFIEKPVTLTSEEGAALLEVQEKTGAKVQVGQCIRLWSAYVYLKDLFDNNTYGRLKNLALRRLSPQATWSWQDWYNDISLSGGAVMDLHIHDVDFARYLLGNPTSMNIAGDRGQVFALYNYPDNVTVQIEGGWDYPACFPFGMYYKANFENATVIYEASTVTVYLHDDDHQFVVDVEPPETANLSGSLGGNLSELGGYFNELKYFYDCLLNDKENTIAPLSEGVASLNLVLKEIEQGGF